MSVETLTNRDQWRICMWIPLKWLLKEQFLSLSSHCTNFNDYVLRWDKDFELASVYIAESHVLGEKRKWHTSHSHSYNCGFHIMNQINLGTDPCAPWLPVTVAFCILFTVLATTRRNWSARRYSAKPMRGFELLLARFRWNGKNRHEAGTCL